MKLTYKNEVLSGEIMKYTMDYSKYDGKRIKEVASHREDLSSYCRNYYEDDDGGLIYAYSDDDNYTEYIEIIIINNTCEWGETFAESFTSEGDIMRVFPEFM